jgi:hypothetical protein
MLENAQKWINLAQHAEIQSPVARQKGRPGTKTQDGVRGRLSIAVYQPGTWISCGNVSRRSIERRVCVSSRASRLIRVSAAEPLDCHLQSQASVLEGERNPPREGHPSALRGLPALLTVHCPLLVGRPYIAHPRKCSGAYFWIIGPKGSHPSEGGRTGGISVGTALPFLGGGGLPPFGREAFSLTFSIALFR